MSDASPALDEAFDRMALSDFELPNGFVNHGPMACEALAALGCEDQIDRWARWFTEMVGEGARPAEPRGVGGSAWKDALGDDRLLPEWVGYFERALADDGWARTVEIWVPRLVPGLATVLFHGAIRTAHAVRAIDAVETPARRAELARALGYWAARFQPGRPPAEMAPDEAVDRAVTRAAANGALHYVAHPSIFNLHGVTGAMAVELLVGHIASEARVAALAQVRAEHAALYTGAAPVVTPDPTAEWDESLALAAVASRDAHQVKLVEACRRGFNLIDDPSFIAAAQRVTQQR